MSRYQPGPEWPKVQYIPGHTDGTFSKTWTVVRPADSLKCRMNSHWNFTAPLSPEYSEFQYKSPVASRNSRSWSRSLAASCLYGFKNSPGSTKVSAHSEV